MNTIVQSAVAGTLALASTGAFAIGIPTSNSSDLVLVIQNIATPTAVYVLDTGISVDSVFPSTGFVSGASLNTTAYNGISDTIAASSTLQSFLAANPGAGDEWELMGAQCNGAVNSGFACVNQNSKAVGNIKNVFTSIQPGSNVAGTTLADLEAMANGLQGAYSSSGEFGAAFNPGTEASTGVSCGNGCQSKYTLFGAPDLEAPLGTSSALYLETSNGTTTATPQSYIAGSVELALNGTLTFTPNHAVPLPAAVWLFGSGLLGLVGVSRRRKVAA